MDHKETPEQELEKRMDSFRRACKEHGMRVTNQRLEIYKTVALSKAHPSAETVFGFVRKKLPSISLDTVYRTLSSLEEMDIIFRVGLMNKARFDADKTPHYHFVCMDCGEVYDIFPNTPEGLPIPHFVQNFGEVKNVNLQFRGICNKCRAKKRKPRP